VKLASKTLGRDARQREIATEVRATIGDDLCATLEIAVEDEPPRTELDVAHASRAELPRRSNQVPSLADDAWTSEGSLRMG
jgi:hypothetical protein